jgi:hypothetical protein
MKLIKAIYMDNKGNEWVIEQLELPTFQNRYRFWVGECNALSKSFRADLKKQVMQQIKLFNEK